MNDDEFFFFFCGRISTDDEYVTVLEYRIGNKGGTKEKEGECLRE